MLVIGFPPWQPRILSQWVLLTLPYLHTQSTETKEKGAKSAKICQTMSTCILRMYGMTLSICTEPIRPEKNNSSNKSGCKISYCQVTLYKRANPPEETWEVQGRVGAWETDFCPDNGSGTKTALGQRGVPPEIQAGFLFVIGEKQNSPLVGGQHKTDLDQRELRVGGRQTPEELSVDKKEMLRLLEL